jgi:hypothetical protein
MPLKVIIVPIGLVLTALVACGDANGLPDATVPNTERTETLYALIGTPVRTPSAYAIDGNRRVRTDTTINFDFAYNMEPDGSQFFIPRKVLGIDTSSTVHPGFQRRSETFEGITVAPSDGYITEQPVPIAVGDRFVVRSRITCLSIGLPKYAKLEVLNFNPAEKTVTFRVLTDENCGYRGLEPGLPER